MSVRERRLQHLANEGFHEVAYREWGDPNNDRVLICVHGISRSGRDFDDFAAAMSDKYRVLCPDMPGRGSSAWFQDKSLYVQSLYISVCVALIARSGASEIDWLGTSMGGRIGMTIAAQRNTPIRKLVINDMGPHIAAEGRADNFKYFGLDPRFATKDEAVAYVRETRAAFGPTTEEAWVKFSNDSLRQCEDGQWTWHYDPGLRETASAAARDDSWDEWERIQCPTYLLWGMKSKLLLRDTVDRMRTTGPCAGVFEVPYAGHCPRLENDEQIGAVREFLLG
jgi:pimeloyl-ACP methyl ester carboxylesterase